MEEEIKIEELIASYKREDLGHPVEEKKFRKGQIFTYGGVRYLCERRFSYPTPVYYVKSFRSSEYILRSEKDNELYRMYVSNDGKYLPPEKINFVVEY